MPQVKVYGRLGRLEPRAALLSDTVHRVLREALGIETEKRFHRFFSLSRAQFVFGPGRSEDYTLIEIYLFRGRSKAAKRKLFQALYACVAQEAGVEAADLEIILFEVPRENWAIHGTPGDEMELGYDVTS